MLRIGIIGAGHFARVHVATLKTFGDRVRIVCYARHERGKGFPEAEAAGAVERDADDVAVSPDVDAVIVAVPNHLHRHYAEQALRAGKHVFCEKPLAMTLPDADAVIAAAADAGRVLKVGHLTRFMPLYMTVADILGSGRLGQPVAVYASRMHIGGGANRSWRMDREMGGGVVFDLLVHDFDLLNWYVGPPSRVVARGRRHVRGGYEYATAIFTYASGALAVAEGGYILRPPGGLRSTLRVVGEKGHIEVDTTNKEAPIHLFEEGTPETVVPVQQVGGLPGELAEFFDTIDGKPESKLLLNDARMAVACAAAVVRAADTGEEVLID